MPLCCQIIKNYSIEIIVWRSAGLAWVERWLTYEQNQLYQDT